MDLKKFEEADFRDRTETVPVPDLKKFFEDGEEPAWEIRGLTAHELSIVNGAVEANKGKNGLVAAMTEGTTPEKVDAIRKALSIIKVSDDVPSDLVRRHMTLVMGSVNPKCSEEMAVKLGVNYPTVLYNLSQKIYALTGQGRVGE
jgi:hypothetical protein